MKVVTRDQMFLDSIDLFGMHFQFMMAIEECSELIKALVKMYREGTYKSQLDSVAEEVADVEIMCEQLRAIIGDTRVDAFKLQKLARFKKLVSKAKGKRLTKDNDTPTT